MGDLFILYYKKKRNYQFSFYSQLLIVFAVFNFRLILVPCQTKAMVRSTVADAKQQTVFPLSEVPQLRFTGCRLQTNELRFGIFHWLPERHCSHHQTHRTEKPTVQSKFNIFHSFGGSGVPDVFSSANLHVEASRVKIFKAVV